MQFQATEGSIVFHSVNNNVRANHLARIAVVIPCYRVLPHINQVLKGIGAEVWQIYVVDDCCPDRTGDFIEENCSDERVVVLRNEKNLGVGGAVLAGYKAAMADGADVIVKIDGDDQMDPALLSRFVAPILNGQADYTKGNRFYDLERIGNMPLIRLFGNAILSFMTKLSSGYWTVFDPTNGYTAIHAKVAAHLPMDKISNRYFFETDMLFRLNTLRAVVVDIPMDAVYGDEKSNLCISKILVEFLGKHIRNFAKRIFYNYFLRDMTLASIELIVGAALLLFGVIFGGVSWFNAVANNTATPLGTIMLAALPVLLGIQFLLAFLGFDIANVPRRPIHNDLPDILRDQKEFK
jgi:glycosyltransferase involved in cell wall biosynthesis